MRRDMVPTVGWLLERVKQLVADWEVTFSNGKFRVTPGVFDYSGTDTIADATTAKTVTHGAGFTPSLDQITVTLGENPTNDPGNIWIDTIGATTFDVNCRNDPGASGLDFSWRVHPT